MGVVVIKCPNTGRELSTGIQARSRACRTRLWKRAARTGGPSTRGARDAKFVDALPPADWVENQDR